MNLTKLNQEDINNLNRSITNNEIETVINIIPTKKNPGTDGFTAKFHQIFKDELTTILFKIKEHYQTHYKKPVLHIPKLDRDATKKKIIGQHL
jgi:hypothetical protein